jgi:starvation-inducible DNA-binding protein
MASNELINAAKVAFSSHFSFYLKAHFSHWNIEGEDFYQYHKMLEDVYNEVYEAVDPFAENIRKLGGYTPGSYTRFSMLSAVEDETDVKDGRTMLAELLADCEKMNEVLMFTYELSERDGERGFSNFLADRQDAYKKHAWFLRSTLK